MEGGMASLVAMSLTHPLDLIRVRAHLQLEAAYKQAMHNTSVAYVGAGEHLVSPVAVARRLIQTEGTRALYAGMSAAILRQIVYSSTKLGLYEVLKQRWRDPSSEAAAAAALPLHRKVAAGLVAGAAAAIVSNPADVAMVRMQADGALPCHQRHNYTSVVDALVRIARREGLASLWTGSSLVVPRAMIVTAPQLATYDQIKEVLISHQVMDDGLSTYLIASLCAGVVTSITSHPLDVIRTHVMNVEVGQEATCKGALDYAFKMVKVEGVLSLYKGFAPTIARQGPFAMIMFVSLEQIRAVSNRFTTFTRFFES
ncbi:hypothetical protein O6H91_Y414400 [Diphasiastrum complanatum]|nr:hypothetical protein O6H91_Y414400 [Diphasiastrum complanatum]